MTLPTHDTARSKSRKDDDETSLKSGGAIQTSDPKILISNQLDDLFKKFKSANLRSDQQLAKLIHRVSSYQICSTSDLNWQCDFISKLIQLELEFSNGSAISVVGARCDMNSMISYWLGLLSRYVFAEQGEEGGWLTSRSLVNKMTDCIEALSPGFLHFSNENIISIVKLISPSDTDIALKMTSSLLISARCANIGVVIVSAVMPTLCHLLSTLTFISMSSDHSNSGVSNMHNSFLVDDILANVAELIWTLMAHGKTATPTINTLFHLLDTIKLDRNSQRLESEMAMLNGIIKSLGATLWGNPPYADGVFSLRIFWLDTLTRMRQILTKLVALYAKSAKRDTTSLENVIAETIAAVTRLVDGHLHALTPDEWDALADIIEFGLAPLIVGLPAGRMSSRKQSIDDDVSRSRASSIGDDRQGSLKTEALALLHQFQFQDSSPPVHFHLTLLRLLLIGEGDLNLHAARGILDEPVEYIGRFMECLFTGKTDSIVRLAALRLMTDPPFVSPKHQGASHASMSLAGSISMASQSTLTQQWQHFYTNLPPPAIWEVCVIHKAPGFITFFLQVLSECASYSRGRRQPADIELQLHAIKTLGRVYRSIYTVSTDREYVLDNLVNIACSSTHHNTGMKDVRIEAIHQIEYALVASFNVLVHTHAKVPRLISALLQIARHWVFDAKIVTEALIPLCRLRSDEYGRASLLPRSIVIDNVPEDGSASKEQSPIDSDTESCFDDDDISVEISEVCVHPFLFCKRGDLELGVFRDDNSSRRSNSKKGSIISMHRVVSSMEDILFSKRNSEEETLQIMIYNTLENWALAGIEFDLDRDKLPQKATEAVKIEHARFLSACLHYVDEDDESVRMVPDASKQFMEGLSSKTESIVLHACQGLMIILNSYKENAVKANFSHNTEDILIFVLKRLLILVAKIQEGDRIASRMSMLLSVMFEYFEIVGSDKLSRSVLLQACQLFHKIVKISAGFRESKLFALKCASIIALGFDNDGRKWLGDQLFENRLDTENEIDNIALCVFVDLFNLRQLPEVTMLPNSSASKPSIIGLHKRISRIVDDMKQFQFENAGAWICEDSIITIRIGSFHTIYQGWIEIVLRTPTRCDRHLHRLSGCPSVEYPLSHSTRWGNRNGQVSSQSKQDLIKEDFEIDRSWSIENVNQGKSMPTAAAAVEAIRCFDNLCMNLQKENRISGSNSRRILQVCSNYEEVDSKARVKQSVEEVPYSGSAPPKGPSAKRRSSSFVSRTDKTRSISDNGNSNQNSIFERHLSINSLQHLCLEGGVSDDIVEGSDKSIRIKYSDPRRPISIRQWLENVYGINKVELKHVGEILQSLQEKLGYGKVVNLQPETELSKSAIQKRREKQLIYDKIQRGLSIMDRTVPIQPHKVALFYSCPPDPSGVGDDFCNDEERLLGVASGSLQFWKFAQGLGELVRAQDLSYFSSGIDTSSRCEDGEFTLVWLNGQEFKKDIPFQTDTIVLFHSIPLMPHGEKSLMVRNRKRHVGNDYVHIIFLERNASLLRRTRCSMLGGQVHTNAISGEFGLVTIFVDTLPATPKFSRVTVTTKRGLPQRDVDKLSILRGSSIVPKDIAPRMVRQIAIRADVLCRSLMEDKTGLASNWEERLLQIRNMKRHLRL